jgi:hypothetical protein
MKSFNRKGCEDFMQSLQPILLFADAEVLFNFCWLQPTGVETTINLGFSPKDLFFGLKSSLGEAPESVG